MTPERKRKAENARLVRLYGITLGEYTDLLEQQKGVCAICGRPPKTRKLAVDHDHKYRYVQVNSIKRGYRMWAAWPKPAALTGYYCEGKTKSQAIQCVRQSLKHASVRGLLCVQCNRGLKFYNDDATRLHAAASYIEKHRSRQSSGNRTKGIK